MSSQPIERAGWMAEHPLTGERVEVVTAEWKREIVADRNRLLAAVEDYLLWCPGEQGHADAHRQLAAQVRERRRL